MKDYERLEELFSQLKQGVSSADIILAQERQRAVIQEGDAKGSESENNVVRALSSLSGIAGITRAPRYSASDREGVDIVVSFPPGSLVEEIKIEVVSSPRGVHVFRDKVRKKNLLKDGQVGEWLARNKRMIIDGQRPTRSIQQSYLAQLTSINDRAVE